MKTELIVLSLGVVLGFLHLFLASSSATRERGLQWNLSPRDVPPAPLSIKAARIDRAFQNYKETFPFFVAAIVISIGSGHTGSISTIGAILYIAARVLYAPLMIFGVIGVRSAVWVASCIGIFAIIAQAFIS